MKYIWISGNVYPLSSSIIVDRSSRIIALCRLFNSLSSRSLLGFLLHQYCAKALDRCCFFFSFMQRRVVSSRKAMSELRFTFSLKEERATRRFTALYGPHRLGKIRPDKSAISFQSLCLEWRATEATRILTKCTPLARSWQSPLFKSEIEILNDLKCESNHC